MLSDLVVDGSIVAIESGDREDSIRYLCPTSCFHVTVKGRKTLFKLEDHVVESLLDSLVI